MHQCPLFAVMGLHSYQLGPESGLGENTVSGGGGLSEMTSFMGSEARGRRRRLSSTQGRPCNAIHRRPGPHVSVVRFVDHTQKRLLVFRLFCTTCSEFLIAAFSSIALLAGCWLHHIPTNHAHHPCHQFSVVLSYSSRRRRAATKNHVHTFRSREKPSRGIGGECRVVNWKLNSTRCMYDPHRYCIKCKRRRRMWSRWGQITNLCIWWYWFCTVVRALSFHRRIRSQPTTAEVNDFNLGISKWDVWNSHTHDMA